MQQLNSITVFCGSSSGTDTIYLEEAHRLGQTLAKERITLVYGGALVGLMGAVADGALAAGGKVIGVLPGFLQTKEIAHEKLTELIIVNSMHERKTRMNELSDGVIALPGGFGTLDELFEMLTWGQLGLHKKPIGLLNIDGYYDDLVYMVQTMTERGFLKEVNRSMLLTSNHTDDLLRQMRHYTAPDTGKWIRKENT